MAPMTMSPVLLETVELPGGCVFRGRAGGQAGRELCVCAGGGGGCNVRGVWRGSHFTSTNKTATRAPCEPHRRRLGYLVRVCFTPLILALPHKRIDLIDKDDAGGLDLAL